MGESRVGWGAAAHVPRLLERQAGGLKRGRASSLVLLAHRARVSGGSGPGPCRAARGALGPGGARSLGRGAAGPGGNRPLSAPPRVAATRGSPWCWRSRPAPSGPHGVRRWKPGECSFRDTMLQRRAVNSGTERGGWAGVNCSILSGLLVSSLGRGCQPQPYLRLLA